MKSLFLVLNLLTECDAIRDSLHSCYTSGAVGSAVLSLLGAYQLLRRSCLRRNGGTPLRA